jgi:hypothetical protein
VRRDSDSLLLKSEEGRGTLEKEARIENKFLVSIWSGSEPSFFIYLCFGSLILGLDLLNIGMHFFQVSPLHKICLLFCVIMDSIK